MTRLYVVRHGRTEHNVAKRIQGPTIDDPLDAVGRLQADALARRFAELRDGGEAFAALYASPLRRAVETAESISRELALPVEPLAGVLEFSWGVYDGKVEEDDVSRAVRETLARWTAGDVHHAPPGGDAPIRAAARAAEAIERVANRHAGRSLIVVGHGRINRILLAHLAHGDLTRMEEFIQSNTGVTLVERPVPRPVPLRRAWQEPAPGGKPEPLTRSNDNGEDIEQAETASAALGPAPGAGEWRVVFANSRAHLEDPLAGARPPHASDAARMHRHGHDPAVEESRAAAHARESRDSPQRDRGP